MILLDTHIWIWHIDNPGSLSRDALSAIEHAKYRKAVHISSISVWEICMLEKKGRLRLTIPVKSWIKKSEQLSFIKFIPVNNEIARKSAGLDGDLHQDPADKIIITTALEKGSPLITKDRRIIDYPGVSTLW